MKVVPERINDHSRPKMRAVGSTPGSPRAIQVHVPLHERSFTRAARLILGWRSYERALELMSEAEWQEWWDWQIPKKDSQGRYSLPSALFQSNGPRMILGDAEPAAQRASLVVLRHAVIQAEAR